jgi:hypothetical protein
LYDEAIIGFTLMINDQSIPIIPMKPDDELKRMQSTPSRAEQYLFTKSGEVKK